MDDVRRGIGPASHVMALGLLAGLQAQAGDPTRARLTLEWAQQSMTGSGRFPAGIIARGLLADAGEDAGSTTALLQPAARRAVNQGSYLSAVWSYLHLARSGRAAEAARGVRTLAARVQAPCCWRCVTTSGRWHQGRRTPWSGQWPGWRVAQAGGPPPPHSATAPAGSPACRLTERQRQVTVSVADGLSNSQVAERLGISRRTVEVHLQLAHGRLGVHDRRSLVPGSAVLSRSG